MMIETSKTITIYVVSHKKFKSHNPDLNFKTIFVGNNGKQLFEEAKHDNNVEYDSHGINIGEKNKNYCELTALYWIWKNDNSDIIGLCHYRRYFGTKISYLIKLLTGKEKFLLNSSHILKYLTKYDIILPKHCVHPYHQTVRDNYAMRHNVQDLDKTREILSRLFPEYLADFDDVMNRRYMYQGNMFITKRNILNEYCEFLFKLLFELEQQVKDVVTTYSSYNQRIYGFISERLFSVWIEHNKTKYKLKETRFICTEDPSALSYFIHNYKYIFLKYRRRK